MASTTDLVVALGVLAGCHCGSAPPRLPGLPAQTLIWTGTQPNDQAGRSLAVGDVDGDGLADVFVGAPSGGADNETSATPGSKGGAYLLRQSDRSGPLDDVASAVFTGMSNGDYYGDPLVLLPEDGLIGLWDQLDDETPLRTFPATAVGMVSYDHPDAVTVEAEDWRSVGLGNWVANCGSTILGEGWLCITSHRSVDDYNNALLYVLPPPLDGAVQWDESITVLTDVPGQESVVDGSRDFDGDGFADLLVGADTPAGGLFVVPGGPTGTVALADVATAHLTDGAYRAFLGIHVHAFDLDGDGWTDAFGAAPLADRGCAYGVAGPWTGDRNEADADWTFCGPQWFGYDFAAADFDGDGGLNLAIGQATAFTGEPGAAYVFADPGRGLHEAGDATATFGSGSSDEDWFGLRVAAGDVDGDGRADLAIGAPYYSDVVPGAGAVFLLFGGGL